MVTSDDEDEEEDSLTETHCFTKLKQKSGEVEKLSCQ